jgi:hypothetical protein
MFAQKPYTQTMKRLPGVTPAQYIDEGAVVLDTTTLLMWQKTDGGEMTWEQAQKYCDTLTLGGYSDWRLANGHELFSIHDLNRKNPALPAVFGNTQAEYWWSSESLVGDAARVWCTNSGGGIGPHPKSETIGAGGTKKFHVRAVRSTVQSTQIPAHFTDFGNDIVVDNATGLQWQQFCFDTPLTHDEARSKADTLTLGGFTDWRVPNIKELHSIREVVEKDPCVDLMYFPCIMSGKSVWSSTTLTAKTTTQAWLLQPELGVITYAEKATKQRLICVRGGIPDVTSIDGEFTPAEALLYPNPTQGLVTLRNPAKRVDIYTSAGQLIKSAVDAQSFSIIDAAPGIYIAVITDNSTNITTTLFIKQ